MDEKIRIEFDSIQEANVMLQLIDIAVRARGLEVAEVGLVFSRKVTEAIRGAQFKKPTIVPSSEVANN